MLVYKPPRMVSMVQIMWHKRTILHCPPYDHQCLLLGTILASYIEPGVLNMLRSKLNIAFPSDLFGETEQAAESLLSNPAMPAATLVEETTVMLDGTTLPGSDTDGK